MASANLTIEAETGFSPVLVGLAEPAASNARRAGILVLSTAELTERLLDEVPELSAVRTSADVPTTV